MAKESIREFILEKFPLAKSRGLDDTTALLEQGVLDSLGILEIVNFLENDLGVAVEFGCRFLSLLFLRLSVLVLANLSKSFLEVGDHNAFRVGALATRS